jgi:uncharacterized protein with HEPN domain
MQRDCQRLYDIIDALNWVAKAVDGRSEDQFTSDEMLVLVHEYFGVHWPLVWQTVSDYVPLLLERVRGILRLEFPEQ